MGMPGDCFGCNVVRQIERLPDTLFVFSHVVLTTDNLKGQSMSPCPRTSSGERSRFLPNQSRRRSIDLIRPHHHLRCLWPQGQARISISAVPLYRGGSMGALGSPLPINNSIFAKSIQVGATSSQAELLNADFLGRGEAPAQHRLEPKPQTNPAAWNAIRETCRRARAPLGYRAVGIWRLRPSRGDLHGLKNLDHSPSFS